MDMAEAPIQKTIDNSPSRLNGSMLCPALVPGLFIPSGGDNINSQDDMLKDNKVQTLYDYAVRFYPASNLVPLRRLLS